MTDPFRFQGFQAPGGVSGTSYQAPGGVPLAMPAFTGGTSGSTSGSDWTGQAGVMGLAGDTYDPTTGRKKKRGRKRQAQAPASYYGGGGRRNRGGQPGTVNPGGVAPPAAPGSEAAGAAPAMNTSGGPGVSTQGFGGTPGMQNQMPVKMNYTAPFTGISDAYGELLSQDPQTMFGEALGLNATAPAAFAQQWYGSHYNPYDLAVALGGDVGSTDAIVNYGARLAQELTGQAGMGGGIDPRYILSSLFHNAMQVKPGQAMGGGPAGPLQAMATMDPGNALQAFMKILQGAIGNIVPQDTFNALVQEINALGVQYITQWGHQPPEQEAKNGGGIINYIASKLGPSFGL